MGCTAAPITADDAVMFQYPHSAAMPVTTIERPRIAEMAGLLVRGLVAVGTSSTQEAEHHALEPQRRNRRLRTNVMAAPMASAAMGFSFTKVETLFNASP